MHNTNDILPYLRLKLNVEHPDLEDCWREGYDSALKGISSDSNPFKPHSREYEYWEEGWWAGLYEEVPLFESDVSDVVSSKIPGTLAQVSSGEAANEEKWWEPEMRKWAFRLTKIVATLAATAVVGYQLLDMVA